jgi:hypothetical protein
MSTTLLSPKALVTRHRQPSLSMSGWGPNTKSALTLALVLATELDWDAALVWRDGRQECGEMRRIALAPRQIVTYNPWRMLNGRQWLRCVRCGGRPKSAN